MMFDNNTYNLMAQAVEESQSLWRIKKEYKDDAKDCDKCHEFWSKLEEDKEQHLKEIYNIISEIIRDEKHSKS
ncbi:MAG: hypothetical protein QCI00_08855 [Candidatus Thermoplasmatota archaeon]|nr:hypothetical protein [Candidatus Thermoplasmatota archaeon]